MEYIFVNGAVKITITASSFEKAYSILVTTVKDYNTFNYIEENIPNNIDM